ncbi:MAG: isoprenyl transferase [Oscillospiraceae bacterium]|nr:isoprenyl transferase [Oscillospiraceae bacterium]MDD4368099.1 isoprenyl transferase [Oscillospiraceae bacterium]
MSWIKWLKSKAHKTDFSQSALTIPEHIAIIMDGNGRWAKKHHLSRSLGHREGAERLHDITDACGRLGVRYLTVYTFSTENWKRPAAEVQTLMDLFVEFFHKYDSMLRQNDVRLRFMGDKTALPASVQQTWEEAEAESCHRQGLQLILAFNYGGRQEIIKAAQHLAQACCHQTLQPLQIDEQHFKAALFLPDVPDPDLLIRTSGELRLSNFLLWQAAYTEFWITDTLWPDFDETTLLEAIQAYSQRDRRYGAIETNSSR